MGTTKTTKANPGKRKVVKAKTTRKDVRDHVPKDLAAKKQHVRDLAKAGNWEQIERLYGAKMVVKARAYVEKNQSGDAVQTVESPVELHTSEPPQIPPEPEKITPQMLAKQILALNGCADLTGQTNRGKASVQPSENLATRQAKPVASRQQAPTNRTVVDEPRFDRSQDAHREKLRQTEPVDSSLVHDTVAPTSGEATDGSKQAPIVICDSQEELTEDQRQRIEERRRLALQKRKRNVPTPLAATVTTVPLRMRSTASSEMAHRTKTQGILAQNSMSKLEHLPHKPVAPTCIDEAMLQELEFAAQITDWDIDDAAGRNLPRMVTPPSRNIAHNGAAAPVQSIESLNSHESTRPMRTYTSSPSVTPKQCDRKDRSGNGRSTSLSQELRVAQEIVWCDSECSQSDAHSDRMNVVASSIPVKRTRADVQRGQPFVIETVRHANCEPVAQDHSSRACASNNDENVKLERFISRHLLDDKLDETVLDFVNMMLG